MSVKTASQVADNVLPPGVWTVKLEEEMPEASDAEHEIVTPSPVNMLASDSESEIVGDVVSVGAAMIGHPDAFTSSPRGVPWHRSEPAAQSG